MTARAPDSIWEKRVNSLIAPTNFFHNCPKTFQSKLWLGWNCGASSAGRKNRLTASSLMSKPIRALWSAGTAHIATLTAHVRARWVICCQATKTTQGEYLDCAVQIFGAQWHGCRHSGLARQGLSVIELIISNYTTVFLCFVLCSSVLGRRVNEGDLSKWCVSILFNAVVQLG